MNVVSPQPGSSRRHSELPQSVTCPVESVYVEFFGFAGAGKTYLAENLNARLRCNRPCVRQLGSHLLSCFLFFGTLIPIITRLEFDKGTRSRIAFARSLFKRIVLIKLVCPKQKTWYCDHGVCQEFLKIVPGPQRDRLMLKVFQFLQPYSANIKIVCVVASEQVVIKRRLERAEKKDQAGRSELESRLQSVKSGMTLEDLCEKIERLGCGVELILFDNNPPSLV